MVSLLWLVLTAAPDPRAVLELHQRCHREGRRASCPESLAAYPAYLLAEPRDAWVRFFYAELLWDSGRYAEATVEYRRVALNLNCRYAKNAAYSVVLGLQEAAKQRAPHRHDGKPWPLDTDQQAYVDAIDFYVENYPDEPDAVSLAARAANLYFDADDFVQAERRAVSLLFHTEGARFARELLGDIQKARERVPEVGASQTVGKSVEIGEGQTIGEPQTIGGSDEDEQEEEGVEE